MKRIASLFLILALLLLCCACGPFDVENSEGPSSDPSGGPSTDPVSDPSAMPSAAPVVLPEAEAYYNVTIRSPATGTNKEALEDDALALAEIFGCTLLLDQVDIQDSEHSISLSYPTSDGGNLIYTGGTLLYAAPDMTPCFVAEGHGMTRTAFYSLLAGDDLSPSYNVGGEEYSVAEAVAYVESFWTENLRGYTFTEDAHVNYVAVFEKEDGTCNYVVLMSKYIEGVPTENYTSNSYAGGYGNGRTNGGFRTFQILVEMDAPGHIYLYRDLGSYFVVDGLEPIDELMTAEDALQRAEDVLAQYMSYTVKEQTLLYGVLLSSEQAEDIIDIQVTAKPYWCLVLEWGEEAGYDFDNYLPNTSLLIDAQTGTAYLVDSLYSTDMQISE